MKLLKHFSCICTIIYIIYSCSCIYSLKEENVKLKSDMDYISKNFKSMYDQYNSNKKELNNVILVKLSYEKEILKLKEENFQYINDINHQEDIKRSTDYKDKIRDYILENSNLSAKQVDQIVRYSFDTASKYSIDPLLIIALMEIESNFDPKAVSKSGARSLLQVTKIAEKEVKIRYDGVFSGIENDIHKNIVSSITYLSYLLDKYNDISVALESYRIGPSKMDYMLSKNNAKVNTKYVFKVLTAYANIRAECLSD